jgi:preprotein translocase subunit SecG
MLHTIVLVIHVLAAMSIIGLVLLQRGKGADAGTGFGAGASGTVFGARGSANFLSHTTGVLVTIFFVTSLALAYLSSNRTAPSSLLESIPAEETAPATPAPSIGDLPQRPSESPPPGGDAPSPNGNN